MTSLARIADAIETQMTAGPGFTMKGLAATALRTLRNEAPHLFKVGDAAQQDGREADGIFIDMIDAVLEDRP